MCGGIQDFRACKVVSVFKTVRFLVVGGGGGGGEFGVWGMRVKGLGSFGDGKLMEFRLGTLRWRSRARCFVCVVMSRAGLGEAKIQEASRRMSTGPSVEKPCLFGVRSCERSSIVLTEATPVSARKRQENIWSLL